ncbi:MAG: PAS domain-containing sensor histidine kinase [Niameybacter sp.]|uniref:sensor histidine kinase n=1 Tax=Niameybacter sp. TaxID=2033640 RepID=UPI002FCA01AE
MKKLLDALQQGICIINQKRIICYTNPVFLDLLGYRGCELIDEPIDELALFKEKEDLVMFRAKKGDYQKLKVKCLEQTFEEEVFKCILVESYTEKEEKEIEQEELEYEKGLQLGVLKKEFFANVSHEFKTPLNIILAMMQLMDKNNEDGTLVYQEGYNLNKYIKVVKQNAYRLLRLVNNLIDMTRIGAGYYPVKFENHNIIQVVEEITMSVAEYIQGKGIELIFDTEEEEVFLACDPEKIERIMLNLLSNAVKYMGPPEERDHILRISVEIEVNEESVCIYVKDNGMGIQEDKIQSIFERFVQVEDNLTARTDGSGIGLALVKSLIELHDGHIAVQSEEGVGSTFYFTLPIRQVEAVHNVIQRTTHNQIEKCSIEFSDVYDRLI